MTLIASYLAIAVSLLWVGSIWLSFQLWVWIFTKTAEPVMERVHRFGFAAFGIQAVIFVLFFLISLLPFDSQCDGMVGCQLTSVIEEVNKLRWNYFLLFLASMAISGFHFWRLGVLEARRNTA